MAKTKTKKAAAKTKKQPAPAKKKAAKSAKKIAVKATKIAARASKARKTAEAVLPTVEATTEARYNWADVTRRIGAPSNDDVALYGVRDSVAELVDRGRQISSEKIVTDLLRWLGQLADDVARGGPSLTVVGFSVSFLRVVASDGLRLKNVVEENDNASGAQSALDAAHATDARAQFELGMGRRDALRAALRVAASSSAARDQVAAAAGTAKTPRTLKAGLNGLVKIGRSWRASGGSVAARLDHGNVTPEFLDATEQLAASLVDAGDKASGAKTSGGVTQRDLDQQDGVCLVHMEHLLEMFNVAYAANPQVPHLVPIATRSYFAHPSGKAGTVVTEPPAGGGQTAPGAGTTVEPPAGDGRVVDQEKKIR